MEALAQRFVGDPLVINVVFWHQLPQHLQNKYIGRSARGRIYALGFGPGEIEYLWSEAGLYEEAAWHCSRLLNQQADHEVISILRSW